MSTGLYQRNIEFNRERGAKDLALAHRVWDATPWMRDVYTGSLDEDRYKRMRGWLFGRYGHQFWWGDPNNGTWQFGSVTLYGWTWVGFATEDQLIEFMEAWPTPDGKTSEGRAA